MNRLSIVWDEVDRNSARYQQLASAFEVRFLPLHGISDAEPEEFTVIDVNLASPGRFSELKLWLKRRPKGAQVILVIDEGASQQAIQAFAIGATDIVSRPLDVDTLLTKLVGDFGSLGGDPSTFSKGISEGVGALQCIFASASLGAPLDPQEIEAAGETVVSSIETEGLEHWIKAVRNHHSQTYQHCLIVTGVATAFGRHLGFSNADQKRISSAGLLHDIGKARIPIAILEKAGPLDEDELAVMKQHPLLGREALQSVEGISSETLDVVTHHHEYLDGSGYPHGLQANDLCDLVRVMTVSDIFGALIERRSYKPPMTGHAAYETLVKMGPKLDRHIVRAFEPISKIQF